MKVIGMASQARGGKDVTANYLSRVLGWGRSSFASNVKRIFADAFNVDQDFIENWKTVPDNAPGLDVPLRKGLQQIGDGFRKIKGDIWIDLAFRNRTDSFIISDVRYFNEMKRIRQEGGVNILLYRPGFLNDDPCGSEAQIRTLIDPFVELNGWEGVMTQNIHERLVDAWEAKQRLSVFTTDCHVPMPPFHLVDIFLINNGTLEDLYAKCDSIVVPYVTAKYAA